MPEGGSGWYADWWNEGERGSPGWESYELDTVIPTILARYPILPQRQYHAIAGFSMGGLGAVYLAGRVPGFFGTVASLSGFVDPGYFAPVTQVGMWATALAPFEGDLSLDAVYGPPNGFYAQGHDPVLLASNLEQTWVLESTGTGVPSIAGIKSLSASDLGATAAIATGTALEAPIISPDEPALPSSAHCGYVAALIAEQREPHSAWSRHPGLLQRTHGCPGLGPVRTGDHRCGVLGQPNGGHEWAAVGRRLPLCATAEPGQSGSSRPAQLDISAAGSAVTITTSGGCAISTPTPATISLSSQKAAASGPSADAS